MAPKTRDLKSKFFDKVGINPHPEYPRPQLQRDSYFNLNGLWEYSILKKGDYPEEYEGNILVPFSPETLLSGVLKTVMPDDVIFYRRNFELPSAFLNDKTILHFGAVDYACAVFVNEAVAGTNRGGFLPFSFDVTDIVKPGINTIRVEVTDPTDEGTGARGKQKFNSGMINYNPQSGIWGTVWLESVCSEYISDLHIVPDIDTDAVNISVKTTAENVTVNVLDNGKVIATAAGASPFNIKLENYELWSPESPKLYDLKITAGRDTVTSYFGMRKFSVGRDNSGYKRLMLNNKPYFHTGILDQGYWSDSKLTPPSDEAMIYDIQLIKDMGFNMIRKHVKIEPLRWYYHCDRLGVLVWQDMVNGGGKYNPLVINVLPLLGINLKDSFYKVFSRTSLEGRKEFIHDTEDTVNLLKNSVSLAMWVPFNEGWGQFDSAEIASMVQTIDPTRTIDRTSGWHDQGGGDFISLHALLTSIKHPVDSRCYLLSEFGAHSKPVIGHMYRRLVFGHRLFLTKSSFEAGLLKLYDEKIIPGISKGLSGCVYTQLSDVEYDINGFVTYDRKVEKTDRSFMKSINARCKIS